MKALSCPHCGEKAVSFREKTGMLFGLKQQCIDCGSTLKVNSYLVGSSFYLLIILEILLIHGNVMRMSVSLFGVAIILLLGVAFLPMHCVLRKD